MAELGDGLILAALIAGTLEYAILMRHREVRRYELLMDASIADAGLRALVRVVLIEDQAAPVPRRRRLRFRPSIAEPLSRRLFASRRYLTRIGASEPLIPARRD